MIDKTKKSNRKCDNCKFYNRNVSWCVKDVANPFTIDYWKRRDCFEWREQPTK